MKFFSKEMILSSLKRKNIFLILLGFLLLCQYFVLVIFTFIINFHIDFCELLTATEQAC